MNGVSLKAWRGTVYLSLAEILLAMNDSVSSLKWQIQAYETAPGPGTSAIELLRSDQRLSMQELLNLFSHDLQIIDGTIEGYDSSGQVVICLRAIDSTWWDIETEDSQILKTITDKFPDAVNLPR